MTTTDGAGAGSLIGTMVSNAVGSSGALIGYALDDYRFYLTPDTANGQNRRTWELIVNPEELQVSLDAQQIPFTAIRSGLYQIAAGRQPEQIRFTALLTGPRATFLRGRAWESGHVLIHALQEAINTAKQRVYLQCQAVDVAAWYQCTHVGESHRGGVLDIMVDLAFSEDRELLIQTSQVGATAGGGVGVAQSPGNTAGQGTGRAANDAPHQTEDDGNPHPGGQYTTVDGDTLYTIGVRAYGRADARIVLILYDRNEALLSDLLGDVAYAAIPAGTVIAIPDGV